MWCLSHCIYCGSTVWPRDEDSALDYEALGYPETRAWEDDLDTVRHWAECSRRVIMPKAVEWLSAGERRFVIEHPFAGMDKEKP